MTAGTEERWKGREARASRNGEPEGWTKESLEGRLEPRSKELTVEAEAETDGAKSETTHRESRARKW